MRLAITTHAIERWADLDDGITYAMAKSELEAAIEARPERCGTTRRGQAVFRVETPRAAYLVAKIGPDFHRTYATDAVGVVVTVLTREMWERPGSDDVDDMPTPRMRLQQIPHDWKPAPSRKPSEPKPLKDFYVSPQVVGRGYEWAAWVASVGLIEQNRRRAEHYMHERERVATGSDVLAEVFKLLTGRGDMQALEAAFEKAQPGAIAAWKLKQGA